MENGKKTGLTGTAEGRVVQRPTRGLSDGASWDKIQAQLGGVEWSPDTLDEIAKLVEASGREIRDTDF